MKLKIKLFILKIIYSLIDFFIKNPKKIQKNSLLLIRLDAIGDYILFRNFIEILKQNEKYAKFDIYFLTNIANKNLAYELDKKYIKHFIYLNRDKFAKNFLYRYKKLNQINNIGYEIVLSPIYTREFLAEDNIIKLTKAHEKIGSKGDLSNKVLKGDLCYTRLIDAKNEILFEFYRNKEFFENLLNTKIPLQKPNITLSEQAPKSKLKTPYAILFIGASKSYRKWGIENFIQTANYLAKHYHIVLCGGVHERQDAIIFNRFFKKNYTNLVGKTTLNDLLYIILKADLMVSNETLAPHIGVALGVDNVFVISNGNHYGRFTPYPKQANASYHAIYPPSFANIPHEELVKLYGFGSNLDINEIKFDALKKRLDEVIKVAK